jgi:oxalate decarboxylase/phosphoglucose isomerase-like protein (cupin superfamily)
MTSTYDPAAAPRRGRQGYKGDAWTVSLPADGSEPILALDTGLDSVAIVRVPDAAWGRGESPDTVHIHAGYDEVVLVQRGSGTLLHGPDPAHLESVRFEAPVTLVLPAGVWHGAVMDPGVTALGTCFYTVAGTVIESFSLQMEIIAKGSVTFADLPVVHPVAVEASAWPMAPFPAAGEAGPVEPADREARVLAYPPVRDGLSLPLDTGEDSLFIMSAPVEPEPSAPATERTTLPLPEFVDVHRHPDVDEFILRRGGAGYILNGETPASITLTPFEGQCVLVMPAGAFHRIVQTEEDPVGESILIYADRRAVVERYETIMAKTTVVSASPAVAREVPA